MRSLGFANKADRNRPPDVANRGPDGKFAAGSLITRRWREMDSNLQYRAVKGKFVPSASGSSRLQSRMWGRENRCSQVREAVISFPSHSALLRLRRAMSRWRSGPQGWVGAIAALKFPLSRPPPGGMLRLSRSCIDISAREPSWFSFLLLRLEPLHRARLGHGLSGLWLAALRGGFVVPAVQLKYTRALHRLD